MGVSLVIDDTTLALLIVLIGALALNIYTARASTPLLHPLLLAKQAEVATVRQPSESAVYRNSNSPTGFDLAARPRRDIVDVRSLIQLGATGSEIEHDRRILSHRSTTSNRQILNQVHALAHAITSQQGAGSVTTLFVAGLAQSPSYAGLIALLAATARDTSGSIQTIVLPPSTSPSFASAVRALPSSITSKAREGGFALLASPEELLQIQDADGGSALQSLLSLTASSSSSIVIVDDTTPTFSFSAPPSAQAPSLPVTRTIKFTKLVDDASKDTASVSEPATADPDPPLQRASKIVAWFPAATPSQTTEWVPASNAVLVAGVTAQLSLFPADKIPNKSDELLLALLDKDDSSSTSIGGGQELTLAHPAGLALALTALYTGAALRIQTLSTLRTETHEINVSSLVSLLFLPTQLSAPLARDLMKSSQSKESAWRGSPLFGSYLRTAALRTLRCGTLPAPRKPVLSHGSSPEGDGGNSVLITASTPPYYSAPASLGLGHLRSVILLTSEAAHAVEQSTLDSLRLELGCAVWQTYLPTHAMAVKGLPAGVGVAEGDRDRDRDVGQWALLTAPITAAHSLDLQAFAPFHLGGKEGTLDLCKGTHVGAPSVSLEVKLAEVVEASGEGRAGDMEGEIAFRGKTVAMYVSTPTTPVASAQPGGTGAGNGAAGAAAASPPRPPAAPSSAYWVGAAQRGSWRSNGTLVLLP
ncbi:hypothetical protein CF327_g3113 [Tilletia walkeri]|nr:hypothetical protein CF327_g3113 [Tilletia walkeri]